jgi:hypothetical protein
LTKPDQWRYCPAHENPADLASQGAMSSHLIENEKWFTGHQFLSEREECWPSQDVIVLPKEHLQEEVTQPVIESLTVNISMIKESEIQPDRPEGCI